MKNVTCTFLILVLLSACKAVSPFSPSAPIEKPNSPTNSNTTTDSINDNDSIYLPAGNDGSFFGGAEAYIAKNFSFASIRNALGQVIGRKAIYSLSSTLSGNYILRDEFDTIINVNTPIINVSAGAVALAFQAPSGELLITYIPVCMNDELCNIQKNLVLVAYIPLEEFAVGYVFRYQGYTQEQMLGLSGIAQGDETSIGYAYTTNMRLNRNSYTSQDGVFSVPVQSFEGYAPGIYTTNDGNAAYVGLNEIVQ